MAGIFKAYDIRGTYPHQVNEEVAHRLGLALATWFKSGTMAVGHDARVSSPSLSKALIKGLTEAGMDVEDIGTVTTPCLNYAVGRFDFTGGVMVTASHNPGAYNGFKICREKGIPVGYETGLKEIERMVKDAWLCKSQKPGIRQKNDVRKYFVEHVVSFEEMGRKLKVVIDAGNGSAGKIYPAIFRRISCKLYRLHFKLDGRFPNHDPNPLVDENIRDLQKVVRAKDADIGIALDGDADRMVVVDEAGRRIPCDIITALIAGHLLETYKKRKVVYDVRSSRVVKEEIEKAGGIPIVERVGHAFIKQTMRDQEAIFGGEVSGHFYFAKNFYCDSAGIAIMYLLNILSNATATISQLVKPLQRYHQTGEVNFEVEDTTHAINEMSQMFSDGKQNRLDGLTVEYDHWWFNVRASNTEPLLRVNLEADSEDLMDRQMTRITEKLGNPVSH